MKKAQCRIEFLCPECNKKFFTFWFPEKTGTIDCLHCEALLMFADGMTYPFHEYLHAQDPRWPKDGAGTGCLSMEEDEEPLAEEPA